MSKLKLPLLLLIGLTLCAFKIDDTPLQRLLKQLAKITENYPQEKVHLHLDKPYYAIGEDMWIKAYVVTAENREPSQIGKVLYLELINDKNEIAKKAKVELENGYGNHHFNLVDSLYSGTYRIRAYTNYMRNYSANFFFEKPIIIRNVVDKEPTKIAKVEDKNLSVKFFPEGGNLVAGLSGKIGVKALTSDGFGANLSGYITDKSKTKVAEFTTAHAGMGAFLFTPLAGEKYTAVVTDETGKMKEFDLPKVEESGYAFAVNSNDNELLIRITASGSLIDGKELHVVGQANGKTNVSFTTKLNKPISIVKLEKKLFPTGITQFTMFDQSLNPVLERLVFVNHEDDLKIKLSEKSKENTVKKKSEFEVQVADINNNLVDGNFSVSVTDMDKIIVDENEETTILSNLLLSSDLKGFIEKPNYYFNVENPDRAKYLDNLLLTQGWSRFIWKDIIKQTEPTITFRPEQSLELSGKVFNQFGKPLADAKVSMFSTTPGLLLKLDTVSDINGNFVFDRLALPENASFIFKATDRKKSKDVKIAVNQSPFITKNIFVGESTNIKTYVESAKLMFQELVKYNMLNSSILLNTVEIKTKSVDKPLLNVPNSANASGAVDYIITEKMLEGSINIFSPFYKTPGVLVKNGLLYNTKGRNSISKSPPPYTIILDGSTYPQDLLTSLNPEDIAGIEVLSSAYNTSVYGEDGAGGIIHITTFRGGGKGPAATNIAKINNAGFSVTKEFYSPDYDDPKTNQQFQDLRSTIYWNPKLVTNQKGLATFSFFNASTASKYKITIEGMDAFGNIGRKVYTYVVNY